MFLDEPLRTIIRHEVDQQPVVEGREITLVRKDGTFVTCLNTAAAVRDPSGKVMRYQGALMDITSRARDGTKPAQATGIRATPG